MKKHLHVSVFVLALATAAIAAPAHKDNHAASDAKAAETSDSYPLKTCLVSDEPLGSMGEFVAYTHREPGKPERTVRFCCEGCIDEFKGDPAKFLKKLDAAEAAAKQARGKKKKKSA